MKHLEDIGARYQLKGSSLDLLLYSDIGTGSCSAAAVTRLLKANPDADLITVHINSLGGSAFDGIAIYNQLAKHPARVVVNIDGVAASAASVIAMAGDEINIAPGASIMIHGTQSMAEGSAEDMERQVKSLKALNASLAEIYSRRTGIPAADMLEMMKAETWFQPETALERGFATAIREPKSIAARMGGMRRLEMPEDEKPEEPTSMEDAPEEEPTAEGDEETVDFNSLGDRLAESTGFDRSAVLAALLEMADELSEAVAGVLETDGTPAEAKARLKARTVEAKVKDDQITTLKAQVQKLQAWQESRVKADITAKVDAKIKGGYIRPDQREDAVELYTADPDRADRIFNVRQIPAGEQAPVAAVSPEDFSEEHLSADERVLLQGMLGARISRKRALARIYDLRSGGKH